MIFEGIDNKWLVVLGFIGLYVFYMLFLKERSKSGLENEYDKVLNSEEYKVKSQWE